jgi:MoaA/NifB/PqqE/SkfB family radical SAM enzyme
MAQLDGAYSPYKVLHHRDRLDILREGRQPAPVHVQLVISDRCNQSCHFCSYRWPGNTSSELFPQLDTETGKASSNPGRMIPIDQVKSILDDCVEMGVKAIQITGGGEPTVHPQHREIFQAVLDRGLNLALVTNGTIFQGGIEHILMRAKWVRVSLDAGHANTYASLRGSSVNTFEQVLSHIRLLSCTRTMALQDDPSHPAKDLVIDVGFVVTKENWREVVDAAKLVRSCGADNFRISAAFQPENEVYFASFYDAAAQLCRTAKDLEAGTNGAFRVFNLFGDRLDDLTQGNPDYRFCGYQHLTTYIGADLNVYRCCTLAYSKRGLIGSIRNQRFRDLWESPEKQADFISFDARGCQRCQFNNRNRLLNYAVEREPAHVSFV